MLFSQPQAVDAASASSGSTTSTPTSTPGDLSLTTASTPVGPHTRLPLGLATPSACSPARQRCRSLPALPDDPAPRHRRALSLPPIGLSAVTAAKDAPDAIASLHPLPERPAPIPLSQPFSPAGSPAGSPIRRHPGALGTSSAKRGAHSPGPRGRRGPLDLLDQVPLYEAAPDLGAPRDPVRVMDLEEPPAVVALLFSAQWSRTGRRIVPVLAEQYHEVNAAVREARSAGQPVTFGPMAVLERERAAEEQRQKNINTLQAFGAQSGASGDFPFWAPAIGSDCPSQGTPSVGSPFLSPAREARDLSPGMSGLSGSGLGMSGSLSRAGTLPPIDARPAVADPGPRRNYLEVVYLPLDQTEAGSDRHAAHMPWLRAPFGHPAVEELLSTLIMGERDGRRRHSLPGHEQGEIPAVVLIETATGRVLAADGAARLKAKLPIMEVARTTTCLYAAAHVPDTAQAEDRGPPLRELLAAPHMPPLLAPFNPSAAPRRRSGRGLGASLNEQQQRAKVAAKVEGASLYGFLFTSASSPLCRDFTPLLVEHYEALKVSERFLNTELEKERCKWEAMMAERRALRGSAVLCDDRDDGTDDETDQAEPSEGLSRAMSHHQAVLTDMLSQFSGTSVKGDSLDATRSKDTLLDQRPSFSLRAGLSRQVSLTISAAAMASLTTAASKTRTPLVGPTPSLGSPPTVELCRPASTAPAPDRTVGGDDHGRGPGEQGGGNRANAAKAGTGSAEQQEGERPEPSLDGRLQPVRFEVIQVPLDEAETFAFDTFYTDQLPWLRLPFRDGRVADLVRRFRLHAAVAHCRSPEADLPELMSPRDHPPTAAASMSGRADTGGPVDVDALPLLVLVDPDTEEVVAVGTGHDLRDQ